MRQISILVLCASLACAQATPELERRVAELERKMRQVDPSFASPDPAADLTTRLSVLERKMEEFLSQRGVAATPQGQAAAAPPQLSPPPGPEAIPATSMPLEPVASSAPQENTDQEHRLPVAGYMDFHVNKDSGDSFRPDFHRFVLLFGHSFSDRVKFWSELELEHALLEGAEESGEIALEQAYLDFLVKPYLNFRAGMMLTPVGIINERHEPPAFNGVERPFVETLIIPTTWRELGFGITGDLGRGFRYRAYMISALDASRFDAEEGITGGRTAGFDASFRNPAKVARLEYAGIRRLTLGTSFYTGHAGFNVPGINPRVSLAEVDGRYSYRRFDFRGLVANTWLTRAGELNQRLMLQTGTNPNIARQMRGWYLEPAVHIMPRRLRNDVILFGRYEKYNTQHRMPDGFVPLPQFNRSSWVTGITYKPNADVAVKFDYVFNRNASSVVRPVDGINLGIGWWF
jgi:hypothetical protein